MSQNIVELKLAGNIPAKKNSRINRGDGMSFPSRGFTDWQKTAIANVRIQTQARFTGHVMIELIFYFGTLGRADTDNKTTSILDMLVKAGVLPDDYWESVAKTSYEAAYRPGRPGAFVRITPLSDDFFGPEYRDAATKRDKRNSRKLR
ncbi:MAG TPA: RusA family crossover junction endodeoxyribonuclease [Candidatus Saccharibacteria bacterium]|nr:RusA family crossover junction endodeoxyribonuclease [Candidatus Saccharibacteria bacterium]